MRSLLIDSIMKIYGSARTQLSSFLFFKKKDEWKIRKKIFVKQEIINAWRGGKLQQQHKSEI